MAAKKSKPKADEETQGIPVRATRLGYYGDQRRKPGDEFTIVDEEELMSWMERLDGGVNPKVKKAADAELAE